MSKIMMWLRNTFLVAVVAALGLSALPVTGVFAQGLNDAATPSAPGQASNARLEKAWAKEQAAYAHLGRMFGGSDKMIAAAQKRIDRAKSNGKDVSGLQSALDAFASAVKQAKSVYDGGQSVITSHQGFDSAGHVTDVTQARATVKSVMDIFKQIKQIVGGPRNALRQAVKAFRDANPPTGTSVPNQNGG